MLSLSGQSGYYKKPIVLTCTSVDSDSAYQAIHAGIERGSAALSMQQIYPCGCLLMWRLWHCRKYQVGSQYLESQVVVSMDPDRPASDECNGAFTAVQVALDRLLHTERLSWDSAYTMGVAAAALSYLRRVRSREMDMIQPFRLPFQITVYHEGLNDTLDGAWLSCHGNHRAWTALF